MRVRPPPKKINQKGELVTTDMGKDEVLCNFFCLSLHFSHNFAVSQALEPQGRDWGNKILPAVSEDWVWDDPMKPNRYKSTEPCEVIGSQNH